MFDTGTVAPSVSSGWGERRRQPELSLPAGSGPLLERPRRDATPFDRTSPRPSGAASEFARSDAPSADDPAEHGLSARTFFQVGNTYICEERADGLSITDQHALHERIIFNEIRARLGKAPLESQRLLIPAVVNLSKAEAALLLSEKDGLAELGVELAEFGTDAVAVNAMPAVLGQCNPESVLHDFLAEFSGDKRDTPVAERRLAAAKMIACKAAVKAGDRLTDSEMRSLLEKGRGLVEGDTCPHGRPVCIFFPFSDLERQFHRR